MKIDNPKQRFFICDFETTGLSVEEGARPIEIGIIVTDNKFNYCGWDTSLFLELSGVGDPKPVHTAILRAMR